MARPKLEIDPKLVERLASIQCTNEEIAMACGCSADTIERNFAGELERGRARGKRGLRRLQYKRARAGSDTMLIWLGKNVLGQQDKLDLTNSDGTLSGVWSKALTGADIDKPIESEIRH